MGSRFSIIQCLLFLFVFQQPAFSQNTKFYTGNKYVSAELVSDLENFQAQEDPEIPVGRIGVYLKIKKDWHIYWQNSGDAAIPTEVVWDLPQGWRAGELRWPLPYRFIERGDIHTFGYRDEVLLYSDLYAPAVEPKEIENLTVKANIRFLVCNEICVPGEQAISKNISYSFSKPLAPTKDFELFTRYENLTEKSHLDFKVVAIPEFLELASDKKVQVVLVLEGRDLSKAPLHQELVFFPKNTKGVEIGRANLVFNDAKSASISFPLKITSEADFGKLKIAGVLGLSEKLTGSSTPLNLPWSFNLKHSKENTFQNPDFAELPVELKNQNGQLLSYRSIDHETQKPQTERFLGPNSLKLKAYTLITSLFLAFVAGLILNLMPCVLPVISIKALSFLQNAEKSRREAVLNSIAFASGIVFSFLVLATIVIILRSFGQELGWGFQFQYPEFVLALCVIVFVLSLGFFEVYTLRLETGSASKKVDALKHPLLKNFFEGVLTTALATPCTAPFLGTVLAFAFTQSSATLVLIFLFIALGLASPYVHLATHPKLLAKLPKPGPWMNTLKELMGFFLLATVVWLLFILNQLTEVGGTYALALLLVIALCLWIKRWTSSQKENTKRLLNLLLILICLFTTVSFFPELTTAKNSERSVKSSGSIAWKAYSEEAIEEAIAKNQTVFIDFTADWCITCKANEKLVIESKEIAELFKSKNVLALKADWTRGDPDISMALRRYNGRGVPHYVLIRREGMVKELPTLLTKSIIRNAL